MMLQPLPAGLLCRCPTLARRFRNALPSRRGHCPAFRVLASGESPVAFCTPQSLDRSVKPAARLFELLENLVNVHSAMLAFR